MNIKKSTPFIDIFSSYYLFIADNVQSKFFLQSFYMVRILARL